MIIRNNTFESNHRDVRGDQNSYEVRGLDNVSRGNGLQFVRAFGWVGPDTSPELNGSLRGAAPAAPGLVTRPVCALLSARLGSSRDAQQRTECS
jgi:hypothetical protein